MFFKRRKRVTFTDLAKSPVIATTDLAWALDNHEARGYALRNPRLPAYLQFRMAVSDLPDARWNLAMNPGLLPRVQLLLASDLDVAVKRVLAANPNLTAAAASVLAWSDSTATFSALAANQRVTLTVSMPVRVHRFVWNSRPSGSRGSAALEEVLCGVSPALVKFLMESTLVDLSLEHFATILERFKHLDPETLDALLEGFTGTPEELLKVTQELSPSVLS